MEQIEPFGGEEKREKKRRAKVKGKEREGAQPWGDDMRWIAYTRGVAVNFWGRCTPLRFWIRKKKKNFFFFKKKTNMYIPVIP